MPGPDAERRNFWAWVAYQFLYRIGWQFKMESTMMAGIVSYLSPSPTVMGIFTTLNNVGRNLSPLLAAPIVDRFAKKRQALLLFWGMTIVCWTALAMFLWTPLAADRRVSIRVVGICYTAFFVCLGASSVAQGALLGRIIPAESRGRAMAAGMTVSGVFNVIAILFIFRVVSGGAFPEPTNYALTFTLTVFFFVLAGAALLLVQEHDGPVQARDFNPLSSLRHFGTLARQQPGFAVLIAVNVTVGVMGGMLQFYTGFWRAAGTMSPSSIILATIVQVFWQSLSSSVLGRWADRHGNRTIILVLVWIEAFIPLAALALGGWEPLKRHPYTYLGVYALIGLRFPVYQLLVNYLLELVPQHEHAMALGAVTTAQLLTAPAPLLLGGLAQLVGYPACFAAASLVGVTGSILAFRLREVRVFGTESAHG